jgi:hypothetical protein
MFILILLTEQPNLSGFLKRSYNFAKRIEPGKLILPQSNIKYFVSLLQQLHLKTNTIRR